MLPNNELPFYIVRTKMRKSSIFNRRQMNTETFLHIFIMSKLKFKYQSIQGFAKM